MHDSMTNITNKMYMGARSEAKTAWTNLLAAAFGRLAPGPEAEVGHGEVGFGGHPCPRDNLPARLALGHVPPVSS